MQFVSQIPPHHWNWTDETEHYIDGVFFWTLCALLTVMMVYKYYDSLTKEDLEFSVGSKQNVWEVKEPLMAVSSLPPTLCWKLTFRRTTNTQKTILPRHTEAAEAP
jgi:hypothetical protein